jgi:hypothetical protein
VTVTHHVARSPKGDEAIQARLNQILDCFASLAMTEWKSSYAAIASSRRLVTSGPNTAMTTKTIIMAPAMKLNTPIVP